MPKIDLTKEEHDIVKAYRKNTLKDSLLTAEERSVLKKHQDSKTNKDFDKKDLNQNKIYKNQSKKKLNNKIELSPTDEFYYVNEKKVRGTIYKAYRYYSNPSLGIIINSHSGEITKSSDLKNDWVSLK